MASYDRMMASHGGFFRLGSALLVLSCGRSRQRLRAAGLNGRPSRKQRRFDGDLVILLRPSTTGERRAEIRGRAKSDSLLRNQEAVCLQVVAGAGYAECYTAAEIYWIDLR
jgi:hypothetical protein